jgi:hypothetical protein
MPAVCSAGAGDTVTIKTLDVTNTGNVMASLTVELVGLSGTLSCLPAGAVAPGGVVSCTHTGHTVTQADIDAGSLSFSVIFTPVPSAAGPTIAFVSQQRTVFASDQSQFSVEVTIVSGQSFSRAGETQAAAAERTTALTQQWR